MATSLPALLLLWLTAPAIGIDSSQGRLDGHTCPENSRPVQRLHPSLGLWMVDGMVSGAEADDLIRQAWPQLHPGSVPVSPGGLLHEFAAGQRGLVAEVHARVMALVPDMFWQAPKTIVARRMVSKEGGSTMKDAELPIKIMSALNKSLPGGSDWQPMQKDSSNRTYQLELRGTLMTATLHLNHNALAKTYYPQVGIEVPAKTGRLTFLRTCLDATSVDSLADHAIPPMASGVRWTLTWVFVGSPRVHCTSKEVLPAPLPCAAARVSLLDVDREAGRVLPFGSKMPPGIARSSKWGSFADCRHLQSKTLSPAVLTACEATEAMPPEGLAAEARISDDPVGKNEEQKADRMPVAECSTGHAIPVRSLHDRTGVWVIDGLASRSEAEAIIHAAWPSMTPGTSTSVTGMHHELPPQQAEPVNERVLQLFPSLRSVLSSVRIRRMVSQVATREPAGGVPPGLLSQKRDLPNGSDWHPPHTDSWDKWYQDKHYGAIITALLYLNDNGSGGETSFPRVGVSTEPRVGRMVIWRNCLDEAHVDPLSYHVGEPLLNGTKWTALWLFSSDPERHCRDPADLPAPLASVCVPGKEVDPQFVDEAPYGLEFPAGVFRDRTLGTYVDCRHVTRADGVSEAVWKDCVADGRT